MRSLALVILLLPICAWAQPRVLHFTRTSGFDHGTRTVSFTMFQSIGQELGLQVDDDATGDPFSNPATLAEYAIIVFSNTSGNNILTAQQRANFEAWVASGGHVLGIHAASDTYRHSTANGSNTGTWDFYAELIGGSVQENPNHVTGTPQYAIEHIGTHASTANLPDPWLKNEEYYYWEGGYYDPNNEEVLRVEETVGPNGQVNTYDAPRPMSWYRELPNDSRVLYTALGHAQSNFTSDMLFRTHIKDALAWLLDGTTGIVTTNDAASFRVYPNPSQGWLTVARDDVRQQELVVIQDATGRVVRSGILSGPRTNVNLAGLAAGHYVVRSGGRALTFLLER